jgi:PAS domain S-box-containing protein
VVADYHFYAALARASHYGAALCGDPGDPLEKLRAHQNQIKVWAENCLENFENRAALVGAEIARIEHRELDAERFYEQAIRSSHVNGFVHNEALANELAARFYAARGFDTIAHAYLRKARYCYLRWGAGGKVRQLDELYPRLREEEPVPGPTSTIGTPVEHLDLATVVKVSQAVSGEIVYEKLIDTLMRTAIEHAGAERGLLILPRGAEQRIEAEATTSEDTVVVRLREASVATATLPESIVHYVVRTQESVILDDALAQNPFSADIYIRQQHARSILCLPLIHQAKLSGLLYLENNLTPNVFTPKRIAVLKLLASQAAISLENSRLYRDLQERETKIRRLVDANIIGIFIWNVEGEIIEANEAFLQMVDYSREDLLSGRLRWTDLTPAEWRDRTERAVAEAMATGTVQPYEKEYFRKDGSRVPVLVGGATFEGSRNEGVAFVLDLREQKRAEDERKRAEVALRGSEERWRKIFENSPVGIALTGVDYHFMAANPALQKMLGYTDSELKALSPLDITDAEDRATTEALMAELVQKVRERYRIEKRLRRKDGTLMWANISVSFVPAAASSSGFFVAITEDITERKRTEEALQIAQAELAHVTRVTSLGELTATIAHEINQPLAAVVTNANASLRWLAGNSPNLTEARKAIRRIIRDGNRADEIIGRIRALARKAPPKKDWLDLNETIGEVVAMVRSEAQRNSVSLQTKLANDLPLILGDKVELQQVTLNLLMNGIEAMSGVSEGSRELVVSSERVTEIPGDRRKARSRIKPWPKLNGPTY